MLFLFLRLTRNPKDFHLKNFLRRANNFYLNDHIAKVFLIESICYELKTQAPTVIGTIYFREKLLYNKISSNIFLIFVSEGKVIFTDFLFVKELA